MFRQMLELKRISLATKGSLVQTLLSQHIQPTPGAAGGIQHTSLYYGDLF